MKHNLKNSLGWLGGLVCIVTLAARVQGAQVTLVWDRSPDSSVTNYTLYYGLASRQYTNSVNTGLATSNTVAGLQVGVTYYFAATARATNGLESDFSNEVSYRPNSGTNTAPLPNAGPDLTITLPSQATLSGAVSDDGLPNPPAATTVSWSKVSGPGTVSFGNASALTTTASFSTSGAYVLRLTASDSVLSASDDLTVTVNPPPPNTAPVVNAGPDQTLSLPAQATLSGTVTDDGLPNPPAATTVTWSKVSGPGTVSFGNASARSTTAGFSTNGTYVLRLSASDSLLSASDDLTVTVNPPGTGPAIFRNPAAVAIADVGPGAPYPSTLSVSGLAGTISQLTVTLSNLSHTYPGDVDILLVGPSGQKVMLMSDAGEDPDISNVTLSFADSAGAPLPVVGPIVSGTYQPTDYEPGDTLAAPAPAGPYGTSLSVFNGLAPNGTWSLYVSDDGPGDSGSIAGGWSLQIATGSAALPPILSDLTDQSTPAGTAVVIAFSVQDPDGPLSGLVLTGSSSNPSLVPAANLVFGGTGSNRTVTVTPAGGQSGTATITVTATDGNGLATSDSFVLTVTMVNGAPVVNAGPDQTITLPSTATLSGTVSDDGLPNPPAATTVTWSKVSGPGTVSFGNANALNTTASFSTNGTYVLRLSASDSLLSASDDLIVTVNVPAINAAPVVNAGPDQTITLPSTVTLSGTVTDDGLPIPPGATTVTWSKVSGPGTVTFGNANTARTLASFSTNGTYVLRLTANDGALSAADDLTVTVQPANRAPVVNAGPDQTITLPSTASLSGTVSDDGLPNPPGATTVSWSKVSGPGAVTFGNTSALSTTASFSTNGTYVLRLSASDSALSASDDVTVTVATQMINAAPVVNAGPDQAITLPSQTTLSGTVTDDGLPNPPAATTVTWTKVSGPGAVTFGNANAAGTWASFSTNGTYVLRLTANDGALSTADDVTITVQAANRAPVVNAGPDQTITLPSTATLSGTVTDDGLPNPPGATTLTWSKVSGPGTVSFGNANTTATLVSFSTSGTYVLRLTANDGALTATDDLTVTVQAANRPPAVNAGPDQTIILPSQATLSGTVTDDGLPNPPGATTVTWSKISGPGTVTFGNANTAGTWASFSTSGAYVLRLTANDGALSATDDLTVTVQSANQAPVVNAGADQTITLPSPATLSGAVTDDGLPNPPGATTVSWSLVSGPGTVSFGNASAASTEASFTTNGTYVLRLTADDGALTGTDDVIMDVLPMDTNTPPDISAIPDQTIPEGEQVGPLAFTVSDAETPADQLTLRATSSNKDVVRNTNIVLQGSGNNWTLTIAPAITNIGTTTIAVSACDGSLTNTRGFTLTVRRLSDMPTSSLTVWTNNFGTVSPDLNGSSLVVGKTYELRAVPATNKVFAGWSGDVTCSTKKLTFVMRSNLVLNANFAAHPFAGSYNGLFYETNQVLHQSSGFFAAQVSTSGVFTATLNIAGGSYALSGQFDAQGRALKKVKRSGAGTLSVALQLDMAHGTEQITGCITNGSTWVAELLADRAIFDSISDYDLYTGKYTLAVAGGSDPATEPAGTGWGAVKVSPKGRVSLAGELADGQAVTQSVPLSRRGEWPLYVSLYSGQGSILGWITMTNQVADDMAGLVSWNKPVKTTAKRYPAGFAIESGSVGSKYDTNFVLNLTTAQVILGGGNLSGIFTNTVVRAGTNLVATSGPISGLGIDPSSGVFRGSFVDPGTGRTNRFGGVVLQKANFGAGYVQGTNQTGFVLLEPQP